MMLMIKRKQFLLSAVLLPVLVSCAPGNTIEQPPSVDTPLDDIFQSSISENVSLMFGEEGQRKLTFVLNLGDVDTLSFLHKNLTSLQALFKKERFFEILLVNLPSENPELSFSHDLTKTVSSVGMYAYAQSPENFMEFLSAVLTRWNEQVTFVREDVIYIAEEFELLPNLDITGSNVVGADFVEKMSSKALDSTEYAPAILVDDELWTGNLDNPTELDQLFNPILQ